MFVNTIKKNNNFNEWDDGISFSIVIVMIALWRGQSLINFNWTKLNTKKMIVSTKTKAYTSRQTMH